MSCSLPASCSKSLYAEVRRCDSGESTLEVLLQGVYFIAVPKGGLSVVANIPVRFSVSGVKLGVQIGREMGEKLDSATVSPVIDIDKEIVFIETVGMCSVRGLGESGLSKLFIQ